MSPLLTSTAVAILWVHGLIHLMGAVVYMRLGSIEGLPYKTVLAGRWDVGGAGAAAFGLLWAVAAAGFVVAGAGLAAGADWWRPMTLVTAALSLVIAYAETRGLRVIENVGPLDGYGIAVVAVWAATWTGLFLQWRTRQLPWAPIRTLATLAVIIAAICLLFAFYRTAPLMA